MSVREYVGARYVPKFSNNNNGDWDNTYSYEALEIVKYGNDYYTAKIPVPVGIAITNTDYWVLTGNYNGAISNLQDEIDELKDVNFVKASDFTGLDDTAILQEAVDNARYLILDRDYDITHIRITKPITFNLGGYKITAHSTDLNAIDVISSNVEIFNGEIYTTVDDPSNVNLFGSCIYVANIENIAGTFIFENINIHDLVMSSNGAHTICYVGEIYNSRMENLVLDGNRSNTPSDYEAITLEWNGTPHVSTFHPHDIVCNNIVIDGYTTSGYTACGFRTSAAFNIKVTNLFVKDSDTGIVMVAGDWASEAAQAEYKHAVNQNIAIENYTCYNCRVGLAVTGNTYGSIEFSLKNSRINATVSGLVCVKFINSVIENADIFGCSGLGIDFREGINNILKDSIIHDLQKTGISLGSGKNNKIDSCYFYNLNLSQSATTFDQTAIYAGAEDGDIITNNIFEYVDNSYFTRDIVSAGTKNVVTSNKTVGTVLVSGTGSVNANNA